VFDAVQFLNADFGLVMVEGIQIPHQNQLCFSLLLSFAEAKESRGCLVAQAKKVNTCYLSYYAY
jgi:hypothetical protein